MLSHRLMAGLMLGTLCVIIYISVYGYADPVAMLNPLNNPVERQSYHLSNAASQQYMSSVKKSMPQITTASTWTSSSTTMTTSETSLAQSRTMMTTTNRQSPHMLRMESIFADRRNTIRNGCVRRNLVYSDKKNISNIPWHMFVENKHAILYCGIPKVGSTFWKRLLTVLGSDGRLYSPYQIGLAQVVLPQFNKFRSTLSQQELQAMLDDSTSFMFVRDPYSRLFSGYENKIYHPNSMFMSSIGSATVRTVRKFPSNYSLQHGHDVTFAEFVRFIVSRFENNQGINIHFSPMYKRCNPCEMKYDYIGKLESFTEDAKHLIDTWKRKFPDISLNFDDIEQERAISTAKGHVRFLYQLMNKVKLFPAHRFMLRTWRDLQIRGFLSKDVPFPYSESYAQNVTKEQYIKDIDLALALPANKTAVKLQRQEALIEAYQSVPLADMERLQKFVLTDCLAFGYNDRPSTLFDRKERLSTPKFKYLDGISET